MKLFGIKTCDTVRKAMRWLNAHQVKYQFYDLRQDSLNQQVIEQWLESVTWSSLLNQRSTTWHQLDDPRKEALNQQVAIELMLAHPTLIKRPVLCDQNGCVIGFTEQDYQQRYGN